MQVFFAVVGASGSLWIVMNTVPSIFMFSLVQMAVHLAVILGLGKLFRFDLNLLLIASNANVGGPTTACGMDFVSCSWYSCGHIWHCHSYFSWNWFWIFSCKIHVALKDQTKPGRHLIICNFLSFFFHLS